MTNILVIETTGPKCSVAIIDGLGDVKSLMSDGELNHLQNLMPMIDRLMSSCCLKLHEISAIAASVGPGSFTGIRIGVSTARAIAQSAGIKTIGVSSLKSFAYSCGDDEVICPVYDARRNQVYGGAYQRRGDSIDELVPGGAYDLPSYLDLLRVALQQRNIDSIKVCGDGIKAYGEIITEWAYEMKIEARLINRLQNAENVARLALSAYNNGELLEYGQLQPDYMRKAEAERKLEEQAVKKEVRFAVPNDAHAIAEIDKRCFGVPWSEEAFYKELTANDMAVYMVAAINENVAGYIGIWIIAGEGHITNVAVDPTYRRRGLAKLMIKEMIEECARRNCYRQTLEVRESNIAAQKLYESFGFVPVGKRLNYYEIDNEDAIVMWRGGYAEPNIIKKINPLNLFRKQKEE